MPDTDSQLTMRRTHARQTTGAAGACNLLVRAEVVGKQLGGYAVAADAHVIRRLAIAASPGPGAPRRQHVHAQAIERGRRGPHPWNALPSA